MCGVYVSVVSQQPSDIFFWTQRPIQITSWPSVVVGSSVLAILRSEPKQILIIWFLYVMLKDCKRDSVGFNLKL